MKTTEQIREMHNTLASALKTFNQYAEEYGKPLTKTVKAELENYYQGNYICLAAAAELIKAAENADIIGCQNKYRKEWAAVVNARNEVEMLDHVIEGYKLSTTKNGMWYAKWNDTYNHAGKGYGEGATPQEAITDLEEDTRRDFQSFMRD